MNSLRDMVAVASALVMELDPAQILDAFADPPFVSVFAAVLGLDWTTSGHTAITLDVLKKAMPQGVFLTGGKVSAAKATEAELQKKAKVLSVSHETLVAALQAAAKVDVCAIQEGKGQLAAQYIAFDKASYVIINQKLFIHDARRYHWKPRTFDKPIFCTDVPHRGIIGGAQPEVIDVTSPQSAETRRIITELAQQPVSKLNSQLARIKAGQRSLRIAPVPFPRLPLPKRFFPDYLVTAKERKPRTFDDLLASRGIGPATIRGLAAIATKLHGAAPSFIDPYTHDWSCTLQRGKSLATYGYMFLDAVNRSRLPKRQRFEIAERLTAMLAASP
ncbi:DUF763 domain-containing protein [Candidatus Woesearchaeota archaeon]|nr:DUF763 domain-containing protein [Candidatus Woesearchaeota archaeon]